MIKKGISVKKCNKKKQVLYRILIGRHGAEFLSWDLLKVAKIGNHLIAFHVCSSENSAVRDHSKFCQDFSTVKKVSVKSSILQTSLMKKATKSTAKHCIAMAEIVGTNRENTLRSLISFPRCCANQLPEATAILLIHKERILSTKRSVIPLRGFRLNSRLGFLRNEESTSSEYEEDEVVEDTESHAILSSEDASTDGSEGLNDQNSSLDRDHSEKFSSTSISPIRKELPETDFGWPLLLRSTSPPSHEVSSKVSERNTSVVEWVMNLPRRSTAVADQDQVIKASLEREIDKDDNISGNVLQGIQTSEDESIDVSMKSSKDETLSIDSGSSSSVSLITTKLSQPKAGWPLLRISASVALDSSRESDDRTSKNPSTPATPQSQISFVSLELDSYNCKRFSYSELKSATCQFSSDNLIGEGGCSNVYKGCLANEKPVAVKVLKSYKEAWNDFFLEVQIISSLKHKNITSLIGVCIEDDNLILVYDFLPKGSLEESLHGNDKESVLPWEVRFNVAVATAEALNYLHNECLRPVIHRDVKSSNILLSNEFEPKLSDFGLAIWGPTESTCMIDEVVVGTFGYIAPEYFMHGRVSDKVDVYSFGVVLLELLSGRRPIGSKNLEGHESLVKWAKPIIESGDLETLLDANLVGDYDITQMQRMVLVANLCINQSARLRPKMSQILELLRGEKDVKEWINSHVDIEGTCNSHADVERTCNQDDDDLLGYGGKPYLDFLYLDKEDGTLVSSVHGISLCCAKPKQNSKLRDYLKEPQD